MEEGCVRPPPVGADRGRQGRRAGSGARRSPATRRCRVRRSARHQEAMGFDTMEVPTRYPGGPGAAPGVNGSVTAAVQESPPGLTWTGNPDGLLHTCADYNSTTFMNHHHHHNASSSSSPSSSSPPPFSTTLRAGARTVEPPAYPGTVTGDGGGRNAAVRDARPAARRRRDKLEMIGLRRPAVTSSGSEERVTTQQEEVALEERWAAGRYGSLTESGPTFCGSETGSDPTFYGSGTGYEPISRYGSATGSEHTSRHGSVTGSDPPTGHWSVTDSDPATFHESVTGSESTAFHGSSAGSDSTICHGSVTGSDLPTRHGSVTGPDSARVVLCLVGSQVNTPPPEGASAPRSRERRQVSDTLSTTTSASATGVTTGARELSCRERINTQEELLRATLPAQKEKEECVSPLHSAQCLPLQPLSPAGWSSSPASPPGGRSSGVRAASVYRDAGPANCLVPGGRCVNKPRTRPDNNHSIHNGYHDDNGNHSDYCTGNGGGADAAGGEMLTAGWGRPTMVPPPTPPEVPPVERHRVGGDGVAASRGFFYSRAGHAADCVGPLHGGLTVTPATTTDRRAATDHSSVGGVGSHLHPASAGGPEQAAGAPNHVSNVSTRGAYSSIPVVRVQLADDDVDDDPDPNPDPDAAFRSRAASSASARTDADDDRRSTGYMEEDGAVTGGLQAIDLQELHRRRKQRRKRKSKFAKNILILSFAFVSLFSATSGLTLLQSSLNRQMGVFGLCANFAAVAVSCLLLPKALIQLLGCKWTIVASMACFMLWIMSNLHPTWGTLIPTAVVMGTGWAPLWTAQCTYFTVTGIEYAKWGDHMPDVVIARMFGIFFMIFMTAPIWGNLLSSSVLSTGHYNRTRPLPLPGDPESIYRFCGAADCPNIYENITNENYNRPDNTLIYTLIGIYLGLSLIGLTLVAFFLDGLELDREAGKPRCVPGSLMASFKQMANPYQVFIIPLTVYTGMEQVFLMVEYTRAYATCALGMEKIGYVVSSYAAVAALMSLTCSQLVNIVGRMPLFLIGAGAHIGCMVVFMRWTPYPDSLIMFIIMPAIWGIGDAIWQSQINAFYGVLFSDQSEAAFSNYRMWESVGFIVSLSYSPFMCVFRKIHVLLGVLIAGLCGYFVVEGLYSKASSERETELAQKGVIVEAESAAAEEEEAPFGGVAQMIRRKSSVYLPQRAVREATEQMRRKSQVFLGGVDNPERVIRRRLSTFAPVLEVTEDNTPLSSAPSTPAGNQRAMEMMTSQDGGKVEAEMEVRSGARRNGTVTPPSMERLSTRQHYNV